MDEELADGLRRAAADRIAHARQLSRRLVRDLARTAATRPLPMTCLAPPQPPAAYGDLVPLGFLLRAVEAARRAPGDAFAGFALRQLAADLRARLDQRREGGLWAFHTGRLVTATDSALVLLGVGEAAAIDALERFATSGGYVPQLWSEGGAPGTMLADPCNRHWRQPDYATTCLVRGLRAEAGLPARTSLAVLEAGFEWRSGLYFANPWLVDWCLALALSGDAAAGALRERLRDEVLAGGNPDGSFGAFDRGLSTALAIVTLAALGYRGRRIVAAQLRLLAELERPEPWPPSTPFYSTFLRDAPTDGATSLAVEGQHHELSLYQDAHHVILASLAQLALGVETEGEDPGDAPPARPGGHPRYRCGQEEYLARFALPPYAQTPVAGGAARR